MTAGRILRFLGLLIVGFAMSLLFVLRGFSEELFSIPSAFFVYGIALFVIGIVVYLIGRRR